MNQIEIVETKKELSQYKKGRNFLTKQVFDNKKGMERTTDGNSWSRFKANVKYWEEELAIYETARNVVLEDQNDFVELVADLEDGVVEEECYACDGNGFIDRPASASRFSSPYPDCKVCFGTGKANVNVCPKCNGAQQITVMQDGEALDVIDCDCIGED